MIPSFTDVPALVQWIRSRTHAEELRPLFGAGEGMVAEAALRHAPRGLVPREVVQRMLEAEKPWKKASSALLALSENRELEPDVLEALYDWAHKEMLQFGRRVRHVSPAPWPSGEVAPAELVRRLAIAGYPRPEGFMEPIRQSVRQWRAKQGKKGDHAGLDWGSSIEREERQLDLVWHAAFLLDDWVSLRPEDAFSVYRAIREKPQLLPRFLRHPSVGPKVAAYVLKESYHHDGVLEAWLEREDLRSSKLLREIFIETGWLKGWKQFFPYATSEEFVRMVCIQGKRGTMVAFQLLKEREPTPEEAVAIVRGIARHYPQEAFRYAEMDIAPEKLTGLAAEDFLPLLVDADAERRLRTQRFWGRIEEARARQAAEKRERERERELGVAVRDPAGRPGSARTR